MKYFFSLFLVFIAICFLSGCAPGDKNTFDDDSQAGFLAGLWHGIISFFTLVLSFFYDSIRMYEVHNTGAFYDLGYILGVVGTYGGSSSSMTYRIIIKD